MFEKFEDYETLGVMIFGLSFHLLENLFFHEPHRRKEQLKEDITGFLALAIGVFLTRLGLNSLFSLSVFESALSFTAPLRTLPSWVKIISFMLIIDCYLYWIHRAMHLHPTLWKTHELHHEPVHMYWFAGYRASFMHVFLYSVPQVFFAFYVFKFTLTDSIIVFAVIGGFIQIWTHTNLTIRLGFLEKILITPQFHRLHHASGRTIRKNYGVFFPWWDKLFNSYQDPYTVPATYPLGVPSRRSKWRTHLGI